LALSLFPRRYYTQSSTAVVKNSRFTITHPFHPLAGREFTIITYRQNWGEDRVFFHDDQGKLTSMPAQWTSIFPEDPFFCAESYFRVPDLLELVNMLHKLCQNVT